MTPSIEIDEFLQRLRDGQKAFDVRTPAEFASGHIPGALNLPLFSDQERVTVGMLYKQEGRHQAILEGLEYVGPKMRSLVETVQREVGPPGSEVLVHCWRGGMRSGSVAWLLGMYGFDVVTLKGGYKSYRHWVLEQLEELPPLRVIGGPTGSGKTDILYELQARGETIIDLEGLANHRGSAFGAHNLPDQPSQEHFENLLGQALFDARQTGRPVWIEDESRMIGMRHLPNTLMKRIRQGPVFVVDVPLDDRLDRLVDVYGEANLDGLRESFEGIQKSLGPQRKEAALKALDTGDLREAARQALQYYDRAYAKGLGRRDPNQLREVDCPGSSAEIAEFLIAMTSSSDPAVNPDPTSDSAPKTESSEA